jgi:hypothetical protein
MSRYEELRARPPQDEIQSGAELARPPLSRRWLILAGVIAVAVAAVVVALTRHGSPAHHAAPRPAPVPTGPPVTVIHTGHSLLGTTSSENLLGYGPGEVVRIQFAAGRLTRTSLPALESTGPVSFLVGPHQVIIRPLDRVPGYLIPDGERPRPLGAVFGRGGTVVPGPRPGTAWALDAGTGRTATLLRLDGTTAGPRLPLPSGSTWQANPDGHGYVLLNGSAGYFDERPSGALALAGTVSAVGRARWLTVDCNRPHCANVVLSPAGAVSRVLPGPPVWPGSGQPGVVSPDGRWAAIVASDRAGHQVLDVINLRTGQVGKVPVTLDLPLDGAQTLAWSPDSSRLFAITQGGQLRAVDPRTRYVSGLGVELPPLTQIGIRP